MFGSRAKSPRHQYSLCNTPDEAHRYAIGVALDPNSRGGLSAIHAQVRVGDIVEVSEPQNHFPLVEEARCSVLIAGGIGVTPILAIARPFHADGCGFSAY